jgi:hypothetical protein
VDLWHGACHRPPRIHPLGRPPRRGARYASASIHPLRLHPILLLLIPHPGLTSSSAHPGAGATESGGSLDSGNGAGSKSLESPAPRSLPNSKLAAPLPHRPPPRSAAPGSSMVIATESSGSEDRVSTPLRPLPHPLPSLPGRIPLRSVMGVSSRGDQWVDSWGSANNSLADSIGMVDYRSVRGRIAWDLVPILPTRWVIFRLSFASPFGGCCRLWSRQGQGDFSYFPGYCYSVERLH